MKINLNSRRLIAFAICSSALWAAGCAALDYATGDRSRTPFVVEYKLASEAQDKWGLRALTNSGAEIFGKAVLEQRNGGRSAFGGSVPFPRSVRVTWREGVTSGKYWTTGTVVGDHTIDVAGRIPATVFDMARSRRNRFVKLQFRIKDDAVLFAWSVDENIEGGYAELMHDGDFRNATLKDGVVVDPGWEK